ncbi:MAG: hypothetical protein IJX40_00780 [Alistipes sp.]|nr:hypothetical protein [Alistipes sp.]
MANNDISTLIEHYPWWSEGHIALAREHKGEGALPHATALVAMLHPTALIPRRQVDVARLTYLSHDDLIDRFLKREEYRIVAEEGVADDLAAVDCDPEEEIVSEDLAEIYANQGLYDEAIDIYRKLSLLNSEKSIYFAGLIATIEQKKNKN